MLDIFVGHSFAFHFIASNLVYKYFTRQIYVGGWLGRLGLLVLFDQFLMIRADFVVYDVLKAQIFIRRQKFHLIVGVDELLGRNVARV